MREPATPGAVSCSARIDRSFLDRVPLRHRLALLLGFAVLPAALATGWMLREDAVTRLAHAEHDVGHAAMLLAERQQSLTDRTHVLLASLGRHPDVRAAWVSPEACVSAAADALAVAPWLGRIAVADARGVLICSNNGAGLGVSVADRPYFVRAVTEMRPTVSDLLVSRTDAQVQIAAAMPIDDGADGGASRVMIGLIDVDRALDARMARHGGEQFHLLDAAGTVVASHPRDERLAGRTIAGHPVWLAAGEAESGTYRGPGLDGTPRVLGFAHVPSSGAVVLVARREADVLAPVWRAIWRTAAFEGAGVLATLVLAWWAGHAMLLGGLSGLARAAEQAEEGASGVFARTDLGRWAAPEVRTLQAGLGRMDERLAAAHARDRARMALLDAVTATMAQGLAAWDGDGRLLACNDRYRAMLDLPPGLAVPGRHYLDVARHVAARGEYGAGDADALARERYAAAASGDGHRFTRIRPNGTVLEVTGMSMPGGGFVTTFTDVTEARAAEFALRQSEAQFRLLAEHSGDVVALSRMDGTRVYVSPGSERVLGWRPDELVGRSARELVHPDDRAWLEAALAALRDGKPEARATYRLKRRDGAWMWVEVHARAHSVEDGQPEGYVATIRDATERKRAEAEILAAYERMETMAATDALTGIANRRRFEEALDGEWLRASREEQPLSVLLMDVDHFKRFNDRYGHPEGDTCLRRVAAALDGVARRPGDLPARVGGEEFALLMPNTDEAGAAEVAERVQAAVLALAIPHGGNPATSTVTASIGVATIWPAPGAGEAERRAFLSAADEALYEAKRAGRNRVQRARSATAEICTPLA